MGKKNKKRVGVVYSTDPDYTYTHDNSDEQEAITPKQQQMRVAKDKKRRKGKEVTLVMGYVGPEEDLKELSKLIKSKCGVGGSVKDGEIIIQGDQRDFIVELLKKQGYTNTKKSGG